MTSRHAPPPLSAGLLLATLGVVYGDIGTSPLYALKECFSPESPHSIPATPGNVLGVLSLVFWSLGLIVSVKYLGFILRADNQGEGGIMALLSLRLKKPGCPRILVLLVLFGAALLTGDGVITPAISVLSAVEGLGVATHTLEPAIVPITCLILTGLFAVQHYGTSGVGGVFGPITAVWFCAIGLLGIPAISQNPEILQAINPSHAVSFFVANRLHGFVLLGSVFLVATGVEALYADMGHFGLRPIRLTWFALVCPALLLNYFGQGALLLADPSKATNPFYGLATGWLLYPMVALSTAATVIASQALISGVFSLTQQAVQMGFSPRITVVHTSKDTEGQIYIPEVNWGLWLACLLLVLGFRSSSALASAYGIAVTATMTITTVAFYFVLRDVWGWPVWKALPLMVAFLGIDIAFLAANAVKIFDGAWVTLLLAAVLFAIMTTWARGRLVLAKRIQANVVPLDGFLKDVAMQHPHRVKGAAVFMASSPTGTPLVLLHHFKHNQVLHENVVLLTITSEHEPEVPASEQITVTPLGEGFFRVVGRFGYMQSPNVPRLLERAAQHGLPLDLSCTSYYLGRETLLPTGIGEMSRWRKVLFAFISRNARPATLYFGLPTNRVVEMGMQVDL